MPTKTDSNFTQDFDFIKCQRNGKTVTHLCPKPNWINSSKHLKCCRRTRIGNQTHFLGFDTVQYNSKKKKKKTHQKPEKLITQLEGILIINVKLKREYLIVQRLE